MAGRYRRKKHKVFKTFGILTAFVLVIGATVAITLALLNNTSDTKTNTFVSDNKLDLELTEPNWENPDNPDNPALGKNIAKIYTPGMAIPKDPTLTNTTVYENDGGFDTIAAIQESQRYKGQSMYVALKLEYQVLKANLAKEDIDDDEFDDDDNWEDIKYANFCQLASIKHKNGQDGSGNDVFVDDFSTKWTAKTGNTDSGYASGEENQNTVFYYNTILGPDITKVTDTIKNSNDDVVNMATTTDHKTTPLFDRVVINESLSQETIFVCGNATVTHNSTPYNHFNGSGINGQSWPLDNGKAIKTWSNLVAMVDENTTGYTFETPAPDHTSPYSYTYNDGTTTTTYYVHVGLIPFRIKVTGYAVQAYIDGTAMPFADAKTKLDKLMGITTTP